MKHLISQVRRVMNQLAAEENAGRVFAHKVFERPEYCAEAYQRPAYLRRQIVVRRLGENRWAIERESFH